MNKSYDGFNPIDVVAVENMLRNNAFWSGDDFTTHLFAKTILEYLEHS